MYITCFRFMGFPTLVFKIIIVDFVLVLSHLVINLQSDWCIKSELIETSRTESFTKLKKRQLGEKKLNN